MEDLTQPEEKNRDVQPSLLLATVVSASQTSIPEENVPISDSVMQGTVSRKDAGPGSGPRRVDPVGGDGSAPPRAPPPQPTRAPGRRRQQQHP